MNVLKPKKELVF